MPDFLVALRRIPQVRNSSVSMFSFAILLGVLGLLFYMISSLLTQPFDDAASEHAKDGVYLVKGNLVELERSKPLLGEWHFAWQRIETPPRLLKGVTRVQIPHSWDMPRTSGDKLPVHGAATYQLQVDTGQHYPRLALQVPPIGSAYRLYVDDKLIRQAGVVNVDAQNAAPGYNPGIVIFQPQSARFTLFLHVSNHDLYWAGIWYPLRLSVPEVLYEEQLTTMLRSGVIIAILLTIAVFNLIQFSLRPSEPLPFIITICCFLVALRETETSQILNIANLLSLDWGTLVRINFLTFYLAAPIFVSFYHCSYPRDFHRPIMIGFYALSALFVCVVLFSSPMVFGLTMWWYQVIVLAFLAYLAWRLVLIVRRKRYGARLVMLGTVMLFTFVINDLLHNMGIINTSFMVSFGLVAFVICQTYLTMLSFTRAAEENQQLYHSLAKRDEKLREFSSSLEDQISIGQQLERQNRELEELANLDTLTGLPNRRSMLPHAKQAIVQFKDTQTPFCLLLVDIDSFKQINDSLGHDMGDRILSKSARSMKGVLREQDVIARWGGEEFLVLLPATGVDGARVLAEKLRACVELEVSESLSQRVTATIGVAEFTAGESFEQTFRRADGAMYAGKQAGRNQVVTA